MSRKDFELIAQVLASVKPDAVANPKAYIQWDKTLAAFGTRLKLANPRFNTERFDAACNKVEADKCAS